MLLLLTHIALSGMCLQPPFLSLKAKNAMDKAAEEGFYVVVSVISLAEIVYLIEKMRQTH